MNAINKEGRLYHKKWNIKNNKYCTLNINNDFNSLKPNNFFNNSKLSKKLHLLSPTSFLNRKTIKQIIARSFKNTDKLNNTNNALINYKSLNAESIFSFDRPKIHIKIHSMKHNNSNRNTISSEKNNNPLKYKIHKVHKNKPKDKSCNEKKIFNLKSNSDNKKKTKFNTIQNSLDYNPDYNTNIKKKRVYSNTNQYYNMMQEQSLIDLNNSIEKLIKKQPFNNYINTRNYYSQISNDKTMNNEENENYFQLNNNYYNELNNWKKSIYRKKIQKQKSNYSLNLFNFNREREKDISSFSKDNKLKNPYLLNNINESKTYKLIYNNYQSPQKIEEFSKTCDELEGINHCSKNCTITFPSFTLTEPKFNTMENEQKNKEYIKIENQTNLTLNNNTYKLMELLNSTNKKNNINKINCKSYIKSKRMADINSIKGTYDILFNQTKNNGHNLYNNTMSNHYKKGNSTNISDFNTINTLNSTEKNNTFFNNDINIKMNINTSLIDKKYKHDYNDKNKMIYIQNDILNNTINKIGKKRLKNVVTSIEFKKLKDDSNNKNIILSELDKNGKLNVKCRKMKNSIEKIIKKKSAPKVKKVSCIKSTPLTYNNALTYIKKNQGTHIRSSKRYNTINRISKYFY